MESSEDGTQSQGVSDGMQYIAVCMTWREDEGNSAINCKAVTVTLSRL